ncbi:MAG: hypothetical protein JW976_05050 [Syntrophaceae bacterium]|nr:hypothetical protein [Syntrophaceae bacterium]
MKEKESKIKKDAKDGVVIVRKYLRGEMKNSKRVEKAFKTIDKCLIYEAQKVKEVKALLKKIERNKKLN